MGERGGGNRWFCCVRFIGKDVLNRDFANVRISFAAP